jgi:lipopolysaccharide/colanic/teichoic acid biosynthesis glycosyltransferase
MAKRLIDILLSGVGLLLCAPLLAACALGVRLDSPGPVLFRQERVGRGGRTFLILKLRTMRAAPAPGASQVTVAGDPRITRFGGWLRRTKLDELPQLWNVLAGDMSLVGPRPEVPRFVAHYPAEARAIVLSVRPGITDPASVRFRNEAELLAGSADPERDYVECILPEKIAAYVAYVRGRSFAVDLRILAATLRAVASGRASAS